MSDETQDQILDAVQAVIVRDGVQGTSMRQVALEADVSVGLLSYHFDDKENLIIAAFTRATDRLLEASHEASAVVDDPCDKVRAFHRGSFSDEFLDGDYLQLRIALWAVSLNDPVLAAIDAEYLSRYLGTLEGLLAAARPELETGVIARRTRDAFAFSNGLWLEWARHPDAAALDRGLQRCEAMMLDGDVWDD